MCDRLIHICVHRAANRRCVLPHWASQPIMQWPSLGRAVDPLSLVEMSVSEGANWLIGDFPRSVIALPFIWIHSNQEPQPVLSLFCPLPFQSVGCFSSFLFFSALSLSTSCLSGSRRRENPARNTSKRESKKWSIFNWVFFFKCAPVWNQALIPGRRWPPGTSSLSVFDVGKEKHASSLDSS